MLRGILGDPRRLSGDMTGHEYAIALSGCGGHVFAVVDVHYLGSGGARAAAVLAVDAAFSAVLDEWTALVAEVVPYRQVGLPNGYACRAGPTGKIGTPFVRNCCRNAVA